MVVVLFAKERDKEYTLRLTCKAVCRGVRGKGVLFETSNRSNSGVWHAEPISDKTRVRRVDMRRTRLSE